MKSKQATLSQSSLNKISSTSILKDKKRILESLELPESKGGIINHPEVDANKLSSEQAQVVSDYITQIKQLEREYDELRAQNLKIKDSQNQVVKRHREAENLFRACLEECNDYILRQQEVSSAFDSEATNKYFFEMFKSKKERGKPFP